MKKSIIITLFLSLLSLTAMAQESAAELFNAGNAAYKAKDYATAIANWKAYLDHPDAAVENTESTTYYIAEAARKNNDLETARSYYQKCIDLDYKADMCTFKLGSTYKSEDPEKYISYMETCVNEYPNSKYYKKFFLPSVTKYYNKAASEVFNKANAEAQAATAKGDAFAYIEAMESKVLPLFEEAEAAFEKTLEFDSENTTALGAIENINKQRETFTAYKAEIETAQK